MLVKTNSPRKAELVMMIDFEELRRRLEAIGEDVVRERLASNVYGPQEKVFVEQWLSSKEGQKKERSNQEYLALARSAKRAAWLSAIAALISAVAAVAAWLH
jgi:hypothetical protein